jgi:hypothetical protein
MQTVVEVCFAAFLFVWLIFIYRTWKAYSLRISIMRNDLDLYFKLPSLGKMVFKFWKPLSSFVEEAAEDTLEEKAGSSGNKDR